MDREGASFLSISWLVPSSKRSGLSDNDNFFLSSTVIPFLLHALLDPQRHMN